MKIVNTQSATGEIQLIQKCAAVKHKGFVSNQMFAFARTGTPVVIVAIRSVTVVTMIELRALPRSINHPSHRMNWFFQQKKIAPVMEDALLQRSVIVPLVTWMNIAVLLFALV